MSVQGVRPAGPDGIRGRVSCLHTLLGALLPCQIPAPQRSGLNCDEPRWICAVVLGLHNLEPEGQDAPSVDECG